MAPSSSASGKVVAAIRHTSCPICLGRIGSRRAAVLSSCMHAYCLVCIRQWSGLSRKCPLCNAQFDRLFFNISISAGDFDEEFLPSLKERNDREAGLPREARPRDYFRFRRLLGQTSNQFHRESRRSRTLPQRRSFGLSGCAPSLAGSGNKNEAGGGRVQWRTSIYRQQLRAIPLHSPSRFYLQQNLRSKEVKERIQQRVEPWIRRELLAILDDPDPTLIVHLASSLWLISLESRQQSLPENKVLEDKTIEQLRPFLHDYTNLFWHELRCFAESPFTLAVYDTVVEYELVE